MANAWPLHGREEELASIRAALGDNEIFGLVVTGRAGVGKTRLVRAALAEARAPTVWVRATATASTIPLGAFAHLLPVSNESADRARLLNRMARELIDSAPDGNVIVCVDDAHFLDDLSAALVHHLAATANAFVVVLAPHGVDVPEPVFALWKDRIAERLDVRELDREQTAALAESVLGGRLDGATEHRLWHLTLGNPLFLREVVQGGVESGTLVQREGVWRWAGPLTATPRLVELISAHTDRADPDERTLLEMLAFGEYFGSEPIIRQGGGRALTATERAGLIVSEPDGRRLNVRLAHPLYGQVIRQRTTALRRRRTYRVLADLLEGTGARRGEDRARLVRWRLAAGLAIDPRLVCAVAESVVWQDFSEATELAEQAVQLGGGFRAKYLAAQLHAGRGQHEAADRLFGELAGDAVSDGQRLAVEGAQAANLAFGLGNPALALETRDPTTRAGILAELGDCRGALDILGPILDERQVPDRQRLLALAATATALRKAGRFQACLTVAVEGVAPAHELADAVAPGAAVRLELARCDALAAAGRIEDAEDRAGESYREALNTRWPTALAGSAAALGTVALAYGNLRAAVRWLREALAYHDYDQPHPFRAHVLALLVRVVAMTGQAEEAETLLRGARGPFFDQWEPWCEAWVAAAGGHLSRAIELALTAADRAHEQGRTAVEIEVLHDMVRFGAPQQARLDVVGEGKLAALFAEHARALDAGDAVALDRVAEGFGDVGAWLLAAEAGAQAARVYRAEGKIGSATGSARQAAAWTESCPDAHTPALALLETPLDLTGRELEIARLVATGLTSRAVADRLVVSVRTVDNVLHGVYAKLGISGRGELASVVGLPSDAPPGSRSTAAAE